ncbi:MAG: hypothetical protein RLY31_822 [Bacteroidota bacterium]|jgi:dihydroorotase
MQLFVREAHILQSNGEWEEERKDVLVSEGIITAIGHGLDIPPGATVIERPGVCLSPGWMDIGAFTGDPGLEHREDAESLAVAAMAGGYTALAVLPNTLPATDSKAAVVYQLEQSQDKLVEYHPIGAVSAGCQGKALTEMYDMRAAGAVAFSDGLHPIQDNGLMLRAMQYVQPFDGLVINQPLDGALAANGQLHEGLMSTSLGLKGIPAMAEVIMVQRDLRLSEYTGTRLHLQSLSAAAAVDLVRQAKSAGLRISAAVAAMNLVCDDHLLSEFDSRYKVMPPIREPADMLALQNGLADGTIDCISSHHIPLDPESKHLEFPYAQFGAIGLESTFGVCWMHMSGRMKLAAFIRKICHAPRQILGLPIPPVVVGAAAELTVFDPAQEWIFRTDHIRSRSDNSPFLGWRMKGAVLAVVNKGRIHVNPDR